jgi:DNA-3-methyladenine glycosylase
LSSAHRLGRRFYGVPADVLAPRLIGCRLVRILDDGTRLSGVIVETEAYLGVHDRAAHTFGGRRTPRNEAMYGAPGHTYVYFTYGMHHCMNVVCGRVGEPTAVLLRALAPDEGVARMAFHRGLDAGDPRDVAALCRGPGNLCRALAIDRASNFIDLTVHPSLWIERMRVRKRRVPAGGLPAGTLSGNILTSPRIGVGYAGPEWSGAALRWFVAGHPSVSGPRHVPAAGAPTPGVPGTGSEHSRTHGRLGRARTR